MPSHVHIFEAHEGGAFRITLTYDAAGATGKTGGNSDTHHGRFVTLQPDTQIVQTLEFESPILACVGG